MAVSNAFLTSHAVADLIGVSPSTVLSWIDKGLLPAFRTPGGHRRVEPTVLVEFLRNHQMPVPRTLLPQAKRMLLIDDDATFLRSTKRQLKQNFPDLDVEMAEGPVEGLAEDRHRSSRRGAARRDDAGHGWGRGLSADSPEPRHRRDRESSP
jgi:excisionase family DNA binding protein